MTETKTPDWVERAFLYHLFPLGVCGAPWTNAGGPPVPRIRSLIDWIEPAKAVGANTVLFGPIWESGSHGYDTFEYSRLDRRLGTNADLKSVLSEWKENGFRVVFDGVFNHCGRGFKPFQDLIRSRQASPYRDWFSGIDWNGQNAHGDGFTYDSWNGHLGLIKFNLSHPEVRQFLFDQIRSWIEDYDLDGLRLDAADVMDHDFLRELSHVCREHKPEFWLLGEVIHGDYRQWAPGAGLHAVTNYELFKGLWSSHNDKNYFEVAWTLGRQFGPEGLYRGLLFSTFGDNHDVDRLASTLNNPAHLYPHAILSATVPGIPTIYYGSEAGITGKKSAQGDELLRPAFAAAEVPTLPHNSLRRVWSTLAQLRTRFVALRTGGYRQVLVASQQFAFVRSLAHPQESVLVVVNSAESPATVRLTLPPELRSTRWVDALNGDEVWDSHEDSLELIVSSAWGRVLHIA